MPQPTDRELEELKAWADHLSGFTDNPRRQDLSSALSSLLSAYEEQRKVLGEIARGETPPDEHGHYLAHRRAVKLARSALLPSPPDGSGG